MKSRDNRESEEKKEFISCGCSGKRCSCETITEEI